MTKFLKDIPHFKNDLDYLIRNDDVFKNFEIECCNIQWPIFEDGFTGMVRILQSQQISFKGAGTLWQNLRKDLKEITPQNLSYLNQDELKKYGFSRQKQIYLSCLIEKNNKIDFDKFNLFPNTEIINLITSIKGFGIWSAQIYLIFCLHRPDVILQNDLVIDNAIKNLFALKTRPTPKEIIEISSQWKGYETAAMLLLWHLQINYFKR